MTREEAIRCLSVHSSTNGSGLCTDKQHFEAKQMAIQALEQELCKDEYIKVPKKALKYRTAGMVAYNVEWLKNHFDIERAVICGAQEPCEDAISRKDAIKQCGFGMTSLLIADCLQKLPSVKPQPCEDAISRRAVLDEINRVGIKAFKTYNDYSQLFDFVDTLPPVKPQERTGYWIYIPKRRLVDETDEGGVYITDYKCTCSECGGDFGFQKMSDAYCKYCGARIEGEQYG